MWLLAALDYWRRLDTVDIKGWLTSISEGCAVRKCELDVLGSSLREGAWTGHVDVGVVEMRKDNQRIKTEIDFVCNSGNNRYYIQSALNIDTHEKTIQESRPLNHIGDNFKKIIVVYKETKRWITDDGIEIIPFEEFLLGDFE